MTENTAKIITEETIIENIIETIEIIIVMMNKSKITSKIKTLKKDKRK